MRYSYRIQRWHLLVAILLHLSLIIGYLKIDDVDTNNIRGLSGSVFKEQGGQIVNDVAAVPIQINTSIGGVEDAREIIAQRRAKMQQEQQAQDSAQETSKSKASQDEMQEKTSPFETNNNESVETEKQDATEVENKSPTATKKATITSDKKADEEKEKREASQKTNSSSNTAKNSPVDPNSQAKKKEEKTANKDFAKQDKDNATARRQADDARAQREAQQAFDQFKRDKAAEQAADQRASQGALQNNSGQGGGDGAKKNEWDATSEQRYRQMVQALVKINFNPGTVEGRVPICRIGIRIQRDGTLTNPILIDGRKESITCAAGMDAILKTKMVKAPPAEIYDLVKDLTLSFEIER